MKLKSSNVGDCLIIVVYVFGNGGILEDYIRFVGDILVVVVIYIFLIEYLILYVLFEIICGRYIFFDRRRCLSSVGLMGGVCDRWGLCCCVGCGVRVWFYRFWYIGI